jgi:hypothetical protein
MRYTILIAAISLIFLGCKKSNTRPELSFKSVNSTTINDGDLLIFTLSFNDIKGSLLDSLLIYQIIPACQSGQDTLREGLPVFPSSSHQQGDITVTYINNAIVPGYAAAIISAKCSMDNVCQFKFVLQDQYGNKSDTVSSPTITIKQ